MSTWKLASADSPVSLELDVSDDGPLNGTLTFKGTRYPVTGVWAASGSVPGRNASAFSLAGRTQDLPDVPNFIAASGIMSGPGANPTQIDLRVAMSSSADGTLIHYIGVLLPLRIEHKPMQAPVKFTPSDKVGNARFGCSMALSADGKTAVIGGASDNNGTGAVWVFIRSRGNWIQQGTKLVGAGASSGSQFGVSVALSADGYTLLIGGWGDNNYAGAVWIFTRSDAGVWQQTQKLTGIGRFGSSVALSNEGDVALIGASFDNNQTGAAWVYTLQGERWSTQGVKLTALGASVQRFGCSVALSAAGDIALIGASGLEGSAWVFSSTEAQSGQGEVWTQPGVQLPARNDRGNNFGFGHSVALSAEGDVALVGSFGNALQPTQSGAWVFSNSNDVWIQQGQKLSVNNPYVFGWCVALSADGKTALISDWSMRTGGVGWLFTFDGVAWKLKEDNGLTGSPQGFSGNSIGGSVALSANAKTYLVCGYDQDIDGTAVLYNDGSWGITHIFVLMLENHSFDNIFGLSGISGIISKASTSSNTYNGHPYPVSKPALPMNSPISWSSSAAWKRRKAG